MPATTAFVSLATSNILLSSDIGIDHDENLSCFHQLLVAIKSSFRLHACSEVKLLIQHPVKQYTHTPMEPAIEEEEYGWFVDIEVSI